MIEPNQLPKFCAWESKALESVTGKRTLCELLTGKKPTESLLKKTWNKTMQVAESILTSPPMKMAVGAVALRLTDGLQKQGLNMITKLIPAGSHMNEIKDLCQFGVVMTTAQIRKELGL